MYANTTTVKNLCINRRSNLSDGEIEAAAAVVEPEIDAKLASRYSWPINSAGVNMSTPPNLPAMVVAIANLMVAGFVEKQTYAQVEGQGMQPNPYGVSLERQGRGKLNDVVDGDAYIPGLDSPANIGAIGPNPNQRTYSTVSGFSGRQRGF